jgi:phospholipase A1/A2
MRKYWLLSAMLYLVSTCVAYADSSVNPADPVQQRAKLEQKQDNNPFSIAFYEPNYLLPFYYTGSHRAAADYDTPDNQSLQHTEVKFQLSVKTPIWKNFFNQDNALYFAYTQLSYWQAYNHSPFFRETNYQPELFFANHVNKLLLSDWYLQFVNVGIMHQSNGRGGTYERTWNRVYLDTIFSKDNWMVSLRPWYVMPTASLNENNPDITRYLGHGRLLVAYKYHEQEFSLQAYNMENGLHLTTTAWTWSFPLIRQLRGYTQFFSGYGQSLLEYDHHTNSVGVGIALNDWI